MMKTLLTSTAFLILLGFSASAQMTIGANSAPTPGSVLDLVSPLNPNALGLLMPRISLSATGTWGLSGAALAAPGGMMVYNTNAGITGTGASGIGLYYWDGTKWNFVANASTSIGNDWSLTGNTSTIAGTNFIGTTDGVDFVMKTSNTERMRIKSSGFIGINTPTPNRMLEVAGMGSTIRVGGIATAPLGNFVFNPTVSSTVLYSNSTGDVQALPAPTFPSILFSNASGVPSWTTTGGGLFILNQNAVQQTATIYIKGTASIGTPNVTYQQLTVASSGATTSAVVGTAITAADTAMIGQNIAGNGGNLGIGVLGTTKQSGGYGVQGTNSGAGVGVYGNSSSGYGVKGASNSNIGVVGLGVGETSTTFLISGAGGSFYAPTIGAAGTYNTANFGTGLFGKGEGGGGLPTSSAMGVLGTAGSSTNQVGVAGFSGTVSNSLPTSGVYGSSSVLTNPGIYANNTVSGGLGLTVIGTTKLGVGTYTWPSVLPTAGQVLSSTAGGVLSWVTSTNGTVTSVAVNSPLSIVNATTTPTISLIGTAGSVLYGNGIASAFNTPGASNTVLHGSATVPSFSQVNLNTGGDVTGILPIANGGTALNTVPTNGQLLIGNGAGYTLSTLTAGAGITVTNIAGGITITNSAISSLTGAGTTDYLARWTTATNLGIGVTHDNNTSVSINNTATAPTATERLTVLGAALNGINASTTSATAGSYGVLGSNSTVNGYGVQGTNSGAGVGVYGNSSSGYGVKGASNSNIGVVGLGVGETSTTFLISGAGGSFYAPTIGAAGTYNTANFGTGLFGKGEGGGGLPTSSAMGVLGTAGSSTNQVGVAGFSGTVSNSLPTSGVYGGSSAAGNPGVYANNTVSGGLGLTVIGTTKLGIGTYTWPSVLPAAGQVLSSTAAGVLSWITPAAGTITSVSTTIPIYNTGTATDPIIAIQGVAADKGGVLYSTGAGTSAAFIATAGSANLVLLSGLAGAPPTWGTASALFNANNGLTYNAGNPIQLGGSLIQNTTITQPSTFDMIYDLIGTGDFQIQKSGTDILHVYSANSNVGLANGTVTNPSYTFINNTDMGLYRNTTNDMRFVTNGVDRMRISKAASSTTAEVWVNQASPYLGDVFSATSSLNGDFGVNGYNTAATTTVATGGVYGEARSLTAIGVWGFSNIAGSISAGGTGVVGTSNALVSNVLVTGSGGSFTGLTTGVYAVNTSNAAGGTSIYTTNGNGLGLVVCRVNYWSGAVQYKILGTGTVSTTAKGLNNDKVVLHAPEAPEIYFEDYGQSRLINGKAHIDLDPLISKNVTINQKHPLRVFIQLEGDCKGVYVTNKTSTGFDVVELNAGASNTNFQWHIVCNRADEDLGNGRISKNADTRFEKAPDNLTEKQSDLTKKIKK